LASIEKLKQWRQSKSIIGKCGLTAAYQRRRQRRRINEAENGVMAAI